MMFSFIFQFWFCDVAWREIWREAEMLDSHWLDWQCRNRHKVCQNQLPWRRLHG